MEKIVERIYEKKQMMLNQIFQEFDEVYHSVALKCGLSDSAFFTLYSICELGNGCLQRDICSVTFTSKQTIHSSIRKLEQAGYLRLETGRGRDKHIFLTEAGERLIEQKIRPILIAESQVFGEMTKEEGDTLLRLSEKYLSILRKNLDRSWEKLSGEEKRKAEISENEEEMN